CLNRSVVDVDYYIEMGGRAYDALGEVAARRGVERSLWDELSEKFSQLVEVLNEVAERTLLNSDTGLVRLYEKWMKTGSARVGVMLREQGVPAIVGVPRGRFVQRARRSTPSRNSSGYCSPSTDWKRRWRRGTSSSMSRCGARSRQGRAVARRSSFPEAATSCPSGPASASLPSRRPRPAPHGPCPADPLP